MAKTKNAETPTTLEEALKIIAEQEIALAAATATIDKMSTDADEQNDIIAELRENLASKTKDLKIAKKEVIVKHDKKSYKVVIGSFRHEGGIYTADMLEKAPEVVKALVEMGSGVLEEVKA